MLQRRRCFLKALKGFGIALSLEESDAIVECNFCRLLTVVVRNLLSSVSLRVHILSVLCQVDELEGLREIEDSQRVLLHFEVSDSQVVVEVLRVRRLVLADDGVLVGTLVLARSMSLATVLVPQDLKTILSLA